MTATDSDPPTTARDAPTQGETVHPLGLPTRRDGRTDAVGDRDQPGEERQEPTAGDIVAEWGHGSFPASDPPANWWPEAAQEPGRQSGPDGACKTERRPT